MTTTTFSQAVNGSLDTAISQATFGTLTTSSAVTGASAIDNRPTSGSVVSFDLADVTITLSAGTTLTAGGSITAYVLEAVDGTNYPTVSGASIPTMLPNRTYACQAISTTTIVIKDVPIGPYLLKLLILNQSGASLTTDANGVRMQRKTLQNW